MPDLVWPRANSSLLTAGTVFHLGGEIGEMVEPTDLKPMMLFANLDTIRVRAYIEELHALKISVGDTAEITADGLPGQKFSGKRGVLCRMDGSKTAPNPQTQ